ncbi:hypothetical protein CDD81_4032 [Ophiocordyceps australis]|uniref:CFEM domain-containing protein n=1 Tax=Ophiocordyceps australis TaxID=1399860 RepID=A0A2C5YBC6_9HYPO|nr:hypothetical protein CDD81_4032 [Ophiocordyceps australis]
MKNTISIIALSLLVWVRLAAGQAQCLSLTSAVPSCAYSCASSAASAVGCTNAQDLACQCTPASQSAIIVTAQSCVIACGPDVIGPALSAGSAIYFIYELSDAASHVGIVFSIAYKLSRIKHFYFFYVVVIVFFFFFFFL